MSEVSGFEQIIKNYESETGVSITINYYDTAQELNIQMLVDLASSGEPDLIQGSITPYWAWAERGAFADISQFIENDPEVSMENFLPNIIEPLRSNDGGLYMMPVSFGFSYVVVNNGLLQKAGLIDNEWTLQSMVKNCVDFTGMTEELPETYAMFPMYLGDRYLSATAEDEIMAAIDFEKSITNFAEIDDLVFENIYEQSSISIANSFDTPYGYGISSCLYFATGMGLEPFTMINTMVIFENNEYEVRNFLRSAYKAGEYLYTPQLAFCINERGNKDGAWDFMKYILSDDVQAGGAEPQYIIENPVNIRASEKRIELIREQIAEQVEIKRNGGDVNGRLAASGHNTEEYLDLINRYFDIYI